MAPPGSFLTCRQPGGTPSLSPKGPRPTGDEKGNQDGDASQERRGKTHRGSVLVTFLMRAAKSTKSEGELAKETVLCCR